MGEEKAEGRDPAFGEGGQGVIPAAGGQEADSAIKTQHCARS